MLPGPTLTTVLRVMNGFNSHYAKEKMEVQGCGALSYLSPAPAVPYPLGHSSLPGPTPLTRRECWRVRLALSPSLSAQSRQETQLPLAGAWGARGPVLGVLCSMTLAIGQGHQCTVTQGHGETTRRQGVRTGLKSEPKERGQRH